MNPASHMGQTDPLALGLNFEHLDEAALCTTVTIIRCVGPIRDTDWWRR